jgi:hypothetical protein
LDLSLGIVSAVMLFIPMTPPRVVCLPSDLCRGGSARVLDVRVAVHNCQQPEV